MTKYNSHEILKALALEVGLELGEKVAAPRPRRSWWRRLKYWFAARGPWPKMQQERQEVNE